MIQRILTIVLSLGLLFSLILFASKFGSARLPGNQQGYEPVQPIAYSHRLHAGELKMDCLYCHSGATRSRHAGIPSGNICLNCHTQVKATFGEVRQEDELAAKENRKPRQVTSAELSKLYQGMGLNPQGEIKPEAVTKSISWTRIHNLPDFVYFDHRAHVSGGVACQTCHGPVESMERMRQFSTLSMGWCVNCHRESNLKGIQGRQVNASIDCATCHY